MAISLPTANIQIAAQVGDRIRKAVERLYVPNGILPQFTVSVGVAEVIDGNDASRLFERAQNALEAAQAESVNCTFMHDGLHMLPAIAASRQARQWSSRGPHLTFQAVRPFSVATKSDGPPSSLPRAIPVMHSPVKKNRSIRRLR